MSVMKFIHLTDPHQTATGSLYDVNVAGRLARAIDHINETQADAALCMITGDIAHWGEPEAYALARRQFERLAMPWHVLIGNHDERQPFADAFPEVPRLDDVFFQYTRETEAGRFIVLDSKVDGSEGGAFCETRLRWLRDRLAETPASTDIYLFMHHAPMRCHIRALDAVMLRNGKDLAMTLKGFRNVRHLFFGHLHRAFHGSWQGIAYSTVNATAQQAAPLFDADRVVPSRELPAYAVAFIEDDGVAIHDISYEQADAVIDIADN